MIRKPRRTCKPLLTPSREAPTQLPISSWDIGNVVRRELRLLRVRVPEAARDHAEDHYRHTRTFVDQPEEIRPRDQQQLNRLERRDIRRPAPAVDRRKLTQQVAGTAHGHNRLAPPRR
jgi:hypothetical protein